MKIEHWFFTIAVLAGIFYFLTKNNSPAAVMPQAALANLPWYLSYNNTAAGGFTYDTPLMPQHTTGYNGTGTIPCSSCGLFGTQGGLNA